MCGENKAMADFANGFYEKVIFFMYCVNRPRRLCPFIDLASSMYRIQGGGDKDLWKGMSCLQRLARHIISPAQRGGGTARWPRAFTRHLHQNWVSKQCVLKSVNAMLAIEGLHVKTNATEEIQHK